MITMGEKIKDLRKNKNMTQDAVAMALNVSRQAVAKWESNQAVPSTANIMKLAELFHVEFQELLSNEQVDSDEVQAFIVDMIKNDNLRKEKKERTKEIVNVVLRISTCYLGLFLICMILFELIGIPNYILTWTMSHGVFLLTWLFSLFGCLFYYRHFGYYTFAGLFLGLVIGNNVGELTSAHSVLHFNTGWIALIICIFAFSLCGILFPAFKRSKITPTILLGKKAGKICLSTLGIFFLAFASLAAILTVRTLAYNRGAEAGYISGYEVGVQAKKNGAEFDSNQLSNHVPAEYQFGTSEYKGYSTYWSTGYQDGYLNGGDIIK